MAVQVLRVRTTPGETTIGANGNDAGIADADGVVLIAISFIHGGFLFIYNFYFARIIRKTFGLRTL